MRLPTKEDRNKGGSPSAAGLIPGQMLSPFSNVWEYLTTSKTAAGKPRKMPRLSLKVDGTTFRLTANDDEASVYASWQGSSWDDLFLMFEEALATDTVPWKASK